MAEKRDKERSGLESGRELSITRLVPDSQGSRDKEHSFLNFSSMKSQF